MLFRSIESQTVIKYSDDKAREHGERSIVERLLAGEVDMVINTPFGTTGPRVDGYEIRSAAISSSTALITTVQGAAAAVQGIEAGIRGDIGVRSLQELHAALRGQDGQ